MADLDAYSGNTMREELLADGINANNSDKTVTEAVDDCEQDLEGFCEQVHTYRDEDNLKDEEAAAPCAATFNESGTGVQRLNYLEGGIQPMQTLVDSRDTASSPFGGTPGQHQGLRSSDESVSEKQRKKRMWLSQEVRVGGDADEEESTLGLSEMRMASLSQSPPAPDGEDNEDHGREENGVVKIGGVVDWRVSPSPICRPGSGSGAFLCSRGSQNSSQSKALASPYTSSTPSNASKASTQLGEQGKVTERLGKVRGKGKGKGKPKHNFPTRAITTREVDGTDKLITTSPNSSGWIQKRNYASHEIRSGGCGDEDGEQGDRGGCGASSTTSQNILAIGVPNDRLVSGPLPCDPALSAADEGHRSEGYGEECDVEGLGGKLAEILGATPTALDTQDINPGNSSQVLEDCSQQRRKTDRDLDEAIAAAQSDGAPAAPFTVAPAGDLSGDVDPSSPTDKKGAVNGGGGASNECLRPRKMGMGTCTGATGGRGRMMPRTPSTYLGSASSKSSTKKSTNTFRLPQEGANHPPNIFDFPSEEEEGDVAGVPAAAIRQTSAERRPCAAQGALKSTSCARKGKGKEKKASKGETPDKSRTKAHLSGYRSREQSVESNGKASRRGAVADGDKVKSGASEGGSEDRGLDTAAATGDALLDPVDPPCEEKEMREGGEAKRRDGDTSAGSPASSLKPSRLVSYNELSEFLRKQEGWKQVKGRGLVSWVWIVPGSQKGKKGEAGIDFLTKEDLVDFACRDKDLLSRFWAYLSESDEEETVKTRTRKGDSGGEGSEVRDVGKSWTVNSDAPDRGAGGETGHGKSTPGVNSTDGRQSISKKRACSRGRPCQEIKIGGKYLAKHVEDELLRGRGVPEIYKKIWPKLQKQGWKWVRGAGLVTHVWLKDGVSKRNGERGVNMFESMDEVLDHVIGINRVAGSDTREQWQQFKILDGQPVLEKGVRAKFRSKRQRPQHNSPKPIRKAKESHPKGAPSADEGPEVGVATVNSKLKLRKQSSEVCELQLVETGNISPPAEGGTGKGSSPAAPAPVQRRRSRSPMLTSKRRCVGRDDSSRRALRDGGCSKQRDAMVKNGITDVTVAANKNEEDGDDGDAATQPQFELSTAMNMIEVKHRAHAATTLVTATRAAEVIGGINDSTGVLFGTKLLLAAAGKDAVSPERASEEDRRMAVLSPTKAVPMVSSKQSNCSPLKHSSRGPMAGCNSPSAASPKGVPGSGAGSRKRGSSPGVVFAPRAVSARRPLAGLGFIVTGIRSEGSGKTRQEIETSIKTLGGTVVDVFDTKSPVNADWSDWLLRQGGSDGDVGVSLPPRANGHRGIIAVSAPDGDRLPKVQVALAARIPIVHPSYVTACVTLGRDACVAHYLLPYGRSALGNHGLVMPNNDGATSARANEDGGGGFLSRDRPFHGKKIVYYAGSGGDSSKKLDTWEFALRVAGAAVIAVVDGGRKADPTVVARGGSRCTFEEALGLIERGQVDCLIGPNNDRSHTLRCLDAAARGVGTMAGTVEWASQCLIHARLLVPNVGTCPWFPVTLAGDKGGCEAGSGELIDEDKVEEAASSRPGGKGKASKGRARGGSRSRRGSVESGSSGVGNSEGTRSGGEATSFYVHSGAKRFVVGDYAIVRKGKGEAASRAPAGGRTDANSDVVDLPRVGRILSFGRGKNGKVTVKVMVMERCDGRPGVLVERAPIRLPESALGSRVLVMNQQQMFATQVYSLGDEDILCLDN